jgi:hypothetical protein
LNSFIRIYPGLILKPFYIRLYDYGNYFYEVTTKVLSAQYKWVEVNHFFQNHRFNDEKRKQIQSSIDKANNNETKKDIIIGEKIRLVGYESAKYSLDKWKFSDRDDRKPIKENNIKVRVISEQSKVLLLCNVSIDGSGICLSTTTSNKDDKNPEEFTEDTIYECVFLNSDKVYKCRLIHIQNQSNEKRYGFRVIQDADSLWNHLEPYVVH